ncbi:hypothetical protein ACFQGE_01480 [Halomicroarcula sp. GCM10025817]|uniref:DUF7311 family protein n=1 Tax=Haloarcula TaxID=2237 RepID=UPI0023E823B3|nr:hypothetical protein [Halomicroarcula sp. SYNS111]
MVRLVLAAVVTGALLAVSTPAISAAGVERTDATLERQLGALSDRLEHLVAADDPGQGASARVVATLRLPGRSLTSAGVERVTFRERGGGGVVTWQVGAGHRGRHLLVDAPLRPVGGALTLAAAGTHRLAFELAGHDGAPVVTVRRLTGGQSREATDA